MYEAYYSLKFDPFRLSPDHRLCYPHTSYKKAKAYMTYALHRAEGLVMITGRPGTGKTTLINELLANLDESSHSVARLATTQLRGQDFLRAVAYAFKLPAEGLDQATLLRDIEQFLTHCHASGRSALLVVDEAQDLHESALTELRLLANMQRGSELLLQAFLVGQEQLATLLKDPGMEQLRQRIIAACHLEPLSEQQSAEYVLHRLIKVGWRKRPRFEEGVFRVVHRFSKGIPRQINLIVSRLMLHGCAEEKSELTSADALFVARELRREHLSPHSDDFELDDLSPPIGASRVRSETDLGAQTKMPSTQAPRKTKADSSTDPAEVKGAGVNGPSSGHRPEHPAASASTSNVRRLQASPLAAQAETHERAKPSTLKPVAEHGRAGSAARIALPATTAGTLSDPKAVANPIAAPLRDVAIESVEPNTAGETRLDLGFHELPRGEAQELIRHARRRRIRLALLAMVLLGGGILTMANRNTLIDLGSDLLTALAPRHLKAATPPAASSLSLPATGSTPQPPVSTTVVTDANPNHGIGTSGAEEARTHQVAIASSSSPDPRHDASVHTNLPASEAPRTSVDNPVPRTQPRADSFIFPIDLEAAEQSISRVKDSISQPAKMPTSLALTFDDVRLSRELSTFLDDVEHVDGQTIKLSLGQQLNFPRGLATIESSALPVLDRLSDTLARYQDLHITVIGHTSRSPNSANNSKSEVLNKRLSKNRARAVADYLTSQGTGLEGSTVESDGLGGLEPRSSNASAAGRQRNRRVDIYIRPRRS